MTRRLIQCSVVFETKFSLRYRPSIQRQYTVALSFGFMRLSSGVGLAVVPVQLTDLQNSFPK